MDHPKESKPEPSSLETKAQNPLASSSKLTAHDTALKLTNTQSKVKIAPLFPSRVVGLFASDAAGKITEANDYLLRLLSFQREDLPLHWNMITASECRLPFTGASHASPTILDQAGLLVEFRTKDGRAVFMLVDIFDRTPDEDHVICIALDQTAHKQVQQQLIQRQVQLQALTAALLQAEELERRRIGQGLHDHIGQILALAKGKLVALPGAALDDNVRDSLEEIQNLINQAIKSIRSLTFELSSPVLYELGLNAALQSLGESLAREHGFRFQLRSKKHAQPLGEDTRFTLYGFAREFLFNVVKHAQAQNVTLTVVRETAQLRLMLEDDGMGFDPVGVGESFDEQRGFGLFSIRQQLNHLGGSLVIDSISGRGTRAVVTVPLVVNA